MEGPVRPSPDPGNINRTFEVGDPPRAVLQWVNPIFRPEVNLDIRDAVDRLLAAGLCAPRLFPTPEGGVWVDDPDGGHWRLAEFLPGRTLHKLDGADRAWTAGVY